MILTCLLIGASLAPLDPHEPQAAATSTSRVKWRTGPPPVEVVEGPILLHADIFTQWGGHTFAYLTEGREHVYWSGVDANEGPAFLGQVPKPGVAGEPLMTRIPLEGSFSRVNPPQVVRTPDEHLHLFISTRSGEDEEGGDLHYWRTERAGDISTLVNRSSLVPRSPYSDFTIRQNAGLSRDGKRIVFCNLTDFVPNKHSMNVPLIWFGERKDEDFHFEQPVVYGEPTSFFYPQVAATDEGPVLLGSVHRDPNRGAELVHLDWNGKVLAWLRLPGIEGESWAFDMQPLDQRDWSQLAIARIQLPRQGQVRGLEFWTYDTHERQLTLASSFPNDLDKEPTLAAAGKFWMTPGKSPLFLNEPGSKQVVAWDGPFMQKEGDVSLTPLPKTGAQGFGYPGIRSVFFPSVLQGSFVDDSGLRPIAADLSRPGIDRQRDGDRCAFLLWWLRR